MNKSQQKREVLARQAQVVAFRDMPKQRRHQSALFPVLIIVTVAFSLLLAPVLFV